MENLCHVMVKIKVRVEKFDGEVTPDKVPSEVIEREDLVPFDALPEDMQQALLKKE